MHKTSAWPLALASIALIVYASLYPFTEWRDQGIAPWAFLSAPLPRYWTRFDVMANVLGYAPVGFLLALSALRSGRARRASTAVLLAALAAAALSLLMEALQSYLPARVPSNVDFVLNAAGGLGGAAVAGLLERMGAIDHWSRFRARWFVAHARGAIVLLALWPMALLFPATVPFGLGHVLERVEEALVAALGDTPFIEWLPLREVELQPLVPGVEALCVVLGVLIPCLLGYSVLRSLRQRVVFATGAVALGVAVTALSAALSYGPTHAWAWLDRPAMVGLQLGVVFVAALLPVPRRGCAALVLLALAVYLLLLNQAPTSAYLAQTLQTWEQGRFIRFHGLAQWLGWLWPYAAMVYVLIRVSQREAEN